MTELMFYLTMQLLMVNEGFRSEAYQVDGVYHIGFGRNLEANMPDRPCIDYACLSWTKEHAFNELSKDVVKIHRRLSVRYICYKSLPTRARVVLIDLTYNVGINGIFKFKRFLASLCLGDYEAASDDLLDSAYSALLPNRSARNVEILQNGVDNLY